MRRNLALLGLAASALAVVALAQKLVPIPTSRTPNYSWTSAHGAIFDGGLAIGANSGLGADTLAANECEARFQAYGWDNEQSPVALVLDEVQGVRTPNPTKVIGFQIQWVALGALADGGTQEVTFNQSPLVYGLWQRDYAGGSDAGLPWFFVGPFSVTGSGGPTAHAMMRLTNTTGTAFPTGFNCFVPLVTGAGVDKVFERVNTIRAPLSVPK